MKIVLRTASAVIIIIITVVQITSFTTVNSKGSTIIIIIITNNTQTIIIKVDTAVDKIAVFTTILITTITIIVFSVDTASVWLRITPLQIMRRRLQNDMPHSNPVW